MSAFVSWLTVNVRWWVIDNAWCMAGIPFFFAVLILSRFSDIHPKGSDGQLLNARDHGNEAYDRMLRERNTNKNIYHLLFLFEAHHPSYW